jgi:hypothetical protein
MFQTYLTRRNLAGRWCVSLRTVDRLRQAGKLPWVDIAGGSGARPAVRFNLKDIEAYEERMRQCVFDEKSAGER